VCEKPGGACGNVNFSRFCKYVTLKYHKETYHYGNKFSALLLLIHGSFILLLLALWFATILQGPF
jgi:hypothetical protein